jgi:hypothetical protein
MDEDVDSQRCAAALIPGTSSFSLPAAVAHFQGLRYGRKRLDAEPAPPGSRRPRGFRVAYGNWRIVAWRNKAAPTATNHTAIQTAMARTEPLSASAEVLAGCRQVLTVWADPDPGEKHGKQWAHYLSQLQAAFGLLIWDYDGDNWWAMSRPTKP